MPDATHPMTGAPRAAVYVSTKISHCRFLEPATHSAIHAPRARMTRQRRIVVHLQETLFECLKNHPLGIPSQEGPASRDSNLFEEEERIPLPLGILRGDQPLLREVLLAEFISGVIINQCFESDLAQPLGVPFH